jgi:hypothetical protein
MAREQSLAIDEGVIITGVNGFMCGCQKQGVNDMSEDQSNWVQMQYLGTNSADIPFQGYYSRLYLARKGDTIAVHPDDVKKLERSRRFVVVAQEEAAAAGLSEDDPTGDPVDPNPDDNPSDAVEVQVTAKAQEEAAAAGLSKEEVNALANEEGKVTVAAVREYLKLKAGDAG